MLMSKTLADRVTECMEAKGLNNAELARLCKVSPPTAYNWAHGKTQQMKAEPLHLAAQAFGVTTTWLSTGKGPKYPAIQVGGPILAQDNMAPHTTQPAFDIWTSEAIRIMQGLSDPHKQAAVSTLRLFVHNLEPPKKRARPAAKFATA